MNKLFVQAIGTFVAGAVLLGLLTFLPAGTLAYWQAWVFIAIFMVNISMFGVYFSIKDPALMQRRKQVRPGAQQSRLQNIVIVLATSLLVAMIVVCGLDRRFGWSGMPAVVTWIGDGIEVFSFTIFTLVFQANSFGGSSIRVEKSQKVSDTGLYGIIRHPMYAGTIVMVIGIALGLGSWWALLILAVQLPVLAIRILDEEKLLEKDLAGYKEYKLKVRYRLIPHVW